MKNNIFIEQPQRGKTQEVQSTPYKAEGRSVGLEMGTNTKAEGHLIGLSTIIVLILTVLALAVLTTSCQKPEKSHLAGTWRWTCTSGGIGGWYYTPESEGFEAEIVFKGSQFTFYKNGKKVISGSYHIDYDVDETYYTNKGETDEPFYSWFNIRFHLTEAQCKKMSEATDGKISLCWHKYLATLGYSEAEGEVLSFCEAQCNDGFCNTFVKK